MSFSQSSCFKALYKKSNDLLLPRSPQDKAFYTKKNQENATFNKIVQSTVEICHLDFLKIATLKPSTSKLLKLIEFFEEIAQSVVKFFSETHLR